MIDLEFAGSPELLSSLVDPLVGDPLGAGQHRTGSVTCRVVSVPGRVQIVPEGGRSLPGPQCQMQRGKDGRTTLRDVAHLWSKSGIL